MTWQLVKKGVPISEYIITLSRTGGKFHIDVYLPLFVRKKISDFEQYGWVNVYKEGSKFLFQFTKKPTSPHSRKVIGGRFVLPWSVVKNYWNDGLLKMRLPVKIEKNDMLIDMKDLKNAEE